MHAAHFQLHDLPCVLLTSHLMNSHACCSLPTAWYPMQFAHISLNDLQWIVRSSHVWLAVCGLRQMMRHAYGCMKSPAVDRNCLCGNTAIGCRTVMWLKWSQIRTARSYHATDSIVCWCVAYRLYTISLSKHILSCNWQYCVMLCSISFIHNKPK